MIVPVILCGGEGKRLWPLSRKNFPKQLQNLLGESSLLKQTVLRLKKSNHCTNPIVICNRNYRYLVEKQFTEIHIAPMQLILEAEVFNTTIASALAALWAKQHLNNPILLIVPVDHLIADDAPFHAAIEKAYQYLETQDQTTTMLFGANPNEPNTHFGYIQATKLAMEQGVYAVEQFIEKPQKKQAELFLKEQGYFWNTGMAMFFTDHILAEFEHYASSALKFAQVLLDAATVEKNILQLKLSDTPTFPCQSLDYALLEKTDKCNMMLLNTEWCDIGNWRTLYQAQKKDTNQNVTIGDVTTIDTHHCYIHASSRLVATIGLSNQTIVDTPDALLIADNDKVQHLNELVDQFIQQQRKEVQFYPVVIKPWGSYEVLYSDHFVQIKKLKINPGAQISTQLHKCRSEHWIVLSGQASVLKDSRTLTLVESQSTYIPVGIKHRLANDTQELLELIEVQMGSYLEDDDIIRIEDKYLRVSDEV